MFKKLFYCCVVGVCVVSVSMGAPQTYPLASGYWNDAGNWLDEGIPDTGWEAMIGGGHTVTIPSGYNAVTGAIQVDVGTLIVESGATFTVDGSVNGAWDQYTGMVVTLWNTPAQFITSGTVNITGDLGVFAGSGNITVNDGSVYISGMLNLPAWWSGNAHMVINGGSVSAYGLMMQPQSGNITSPETSSIDIRGGELIIRNTRGYGALVQTYIDVEEIFTSLPGAHLEVTNENGYTVVRAVVPEPAALCLLGLGSLFAVRRNKK